MTDDAQFERAVAVVLAEGAKHDRSHWSNEAEFFFRGYIKGVAAALEVDRDRLLREIDHVWRKGLGLEEGE